MEEVIGFSWRGQYEWCWYTWSWLKGWICELVGLEFRRGWLGVLASLPSFHFIVSLYASFLGAWCFVSVVGLFGMGVFSIFISWVSFLVYYSPLHISIKSFPVAYPKYIYIYPNNKTKSLTRLMFSFIYLLFISELDFSYFD